MQEYFKEEERMTEVLSPMAGRVQEILVAVGQEVEEDQVLAIIE